MAKPVIAKQTYKLPTGKMKIQTKPLLMLKNIKKNASSDKFLTFVVCLYF